MYAEIAKINEMIYVEHLKVVYFNHNSVEIFPVLISKAEQRFFLVIKICNLLKSVFSRVTIN